MARALSAGEGALPFSDPAKLLNARCCAENGTETGAGGGAAEIGRGGEEETVEEEEGERGGRRTDLPDTEEEAAYLLKGLRHNYVAAPYC